MKASKAFYKTLKHIMNGVNAIFSLGFNNYPNNDLLIPLLLLGKLAKYVIGFPLGLLIGGLAAITVSIINLFNAEKKQHRVEEESSDFVEDSDDTSSESFEPIINDLSIYIEDEFSRVETVNGPFNLVEKLEKKKPAVTVKSNIVENKFEQSVFLNKISNLATKADLLVQFIGKKITLLNPNFEKHIAVQNRCSSLKSDLFNARSVAETAQILSHYNTHIEKKVSCPCGMSYGLICNNCKMPVTTKEIKKTVPVYVADETKRKKAKENCVTIESNLKSESNKLTTTIVDYEKCCALIQIIRKIELFVSRCEEIRTESALCLMLADYNKILIDLQNTLSDKDEFNINHFLPKSEYAQLFVASKMIQQINKYNGFFQALPQELKTKIAVSTIDSDFAEEEAKDFYLSCV